MGIEQTENIMCCIPSEAWIDSYSQLQVKFKCKSKVNDDVQLQVRKYCISKEIHEIRSSDYSYSAIFDFSGDNEDPTLLHLTGKEITP